MPSASTTGSLWKRRNDSPKCPSHGQSNTAGVQANEVLSVLFTAESKHCYSQDTAQCTLGPVSRTGPLELYLKMSQPWTCLLGTLREEMRPQRAVLSSMVSFISISSGFLQENYSRDKRRRNLGAGSSVVGSRAEAHPQNRIASFSKVAIPGPQHSCTENGWSLALNR